MARTERATSPAAQKRDRSLNRTGLDPNPRKHGAGPHNWGALEQEAELENEAVYDVSEEAPGVAVGDVPASTEHVELSPQEIEEARRLRKEAAKGGHVDLRDIARTSAAVHASPTNKDVTSITNAADTGAKA
ncbi:hypothetical protein EV122DRAFT_278258 [Schizophyllum commune]|nr:hypothetical protein K525DRAFT_256692 [Schizophyllum commune Loenen D]